MKHVSVKKLLKDVAEKRKENPCSTRSGLECKNECVWKNDSCIDNDILSEYTEQLCDPRRIHQQEYKKNIIRISKHFGYTEETFGKKSWKDVTKYMMCNRVMKDITLAKDKITSQPWKELGLSKEEYDKSINYALEEYRTGKTFWQVFDSLKKIFKNTIIALTIIFIAGTFVISTYTASLPTTTKSSGSERDLQIFKKSGEIKSLEMIPHLQKAIENIPSSGLFASDKSVIHSIWEYPELHDYISIEPLKDFITPEELHDSTFSSKNVIEKCDISTGIERKYIDDILKNISKKSTLEIDKYGLIPGQQIFYGGAFKLEQLTHHGIYIGNGFVAEVGSGSNACRQVTRSNLHKFLDQVFGLSPLEDFAKRAEERGSKIYIIETEDDTNPKSVSQRFERMKEILGCWDYFLNENCQSAANYVTFGQRTSTQAKYIINSARIISLVTSLFLLNIKKIVK